MRGKREKHVQKKIHPNFIIRNARMNPGIKLRQEAASERQTGS